MGILSYGPHGNQHLRRQRGLGFTHGGDAGVEWRSREELGLGQMFRGEWTASAQCGSVNEEPGGKDEFRWSVRLESRWGGEGK